VTTHRIIFDGPATELAIGTFDDHSEVAVPLEPGEKALASIEATIDAPRIHTEHIASGIESLTQLHVHYVSGDNSVPDCQEADEKTGVEYRVRFRPVTSTVGSSVCIRRS